MPQVPNFRDFGRMVDRSLLYIVCRMQRRHGLCFAAEGALRRMVYEETGHMPGVDTLPRALERLDARGIVYHRWLLPGGNLPDGSPCTYGTRIAYVPQARRERRALPGFNRREGITGRVDRRALATLEQARRAIASLSEGPGLPSRQEQIDRARALALEQLRELEATWQGEESPNPAPGEPAK